MFCVRWRQLGAGGGLIVAALGEARTSRTIWLAHLSLTNNRPDLARATVERLRPLARDAGDEDALDGIEPILEAGGAARQRTAFATGGMAGLLRSLVEETADHGFRRASSSGRPRSRRGAE